MQNRFLENSLILYLVPLGQRGRDEKMREKIIIKWIKWVKRNMNERAYDIQIPSNVVIDPI